MRKCLCVNRTSSRSPLHSRSTWTGPLCAGDGRRSSPPQKTKASPCLHCRNRSTPSPISGPHENCSPRRHVRCMAGANCRQRWRPFLRSATLLSRDEMGGNASAGGPSVSPRVLGRPGRCTILIPSQRKDGDRVDRPDARRPRVGGRTTPFPSTCTAYNGRHRLVPRLRNNTVGGRRPLERDPRPERARCTAELVAPHHGPPPRIPATDNRAACRAFRGRTPSLHAEGQEICML